jgi:hypothetical protein
MDTTINWRIKHYENKIYNLRCKLDTFRKGITKKLRAFVISLIWEIERISEVLENLLYQQECQEKAVKTAKLTLVANKGKRAWLARLSPEIDVIYGGFSKTFLEPESVKFHSKTVDFSFEVVTECDEAENAIYKDSDNNFWEVRNNKLSLISYGDVCLRFNKEANVESTPNVVQLLKTAAYQQGADKNFTIAQISGAIAQYFNFNSISRLQSTGVDWALIQIMNFAKNY